jgi:hypothetical protein
LSKRTNERSNFFLLSFFLSFPYFRFLGFVLLRMDGWMWIDQAAACTAAAAKHQWGRRRNLGQN